MNDVVAVEGLQVGFGRQRVLRDLDWRLAPGKVTVLLGSNGAGKSTLLRVLLGVLRPRRGRVRVLGVDPVRAHARVRRAVRTFGGATAHQVPGAVARSRHEGHAGGGAGT